MNIVQLGQVFTPEPIVEKMLKLRQNFGIILEPCVGAGVFFNKLSDPKIGIEIDPRYAPKGCFIMDFFENYGLENKFKTIIGNPPYVTYKNIYPGTKEKLKPWSCIFDERTNLYLFFIFKCLSHLEPGGELIFITPRDFIKATSARKLNKWMYQQGTITHFYELGDEVVFSDATPNCVIWRYEAENLSHKTETNDGLKNQILMDGQICFTSGEYIVPFKDLFFVKVGGVSGLDHLYVHENGNQEFVCSYTKKTGKTKRMFYNIKNDYLLKYKEKLLARKIKKFDETDWWQWGREYYVSDLPRVYVNTKTRQNNPFFTHPCRAYDGSVLAIFIKINILEKEAADKLNKVNWQELGFKVGGRYCFSQRSLETIMLPSKLF
jgi:adenine-specific DNA-methyltransferase